MGGLTSLSLPAEQQRRPFTYGIHIAAGPFALAGYANATFGNRDVVDWAWKACSVQSESFQFVDLGEKSKYQIELP